MSHYCFKTVTKLVQFFLIQKESLKHDEDDDDGDNDDTGEDDTDGNDDDEKEDESSSSDVNTRTLWQVYLYWPKHSFYTRVS